MPDDTVFALRQPGDVADPLTDILRNGRAPAFGSGSGGRGRRVFCRSRRSCERRWPPAPVRHGHLPERTIQTGIGPVEVRQPRVRDRGAAEGDHLRFSPTILPPYARRTRSLDALLPVLYLRGISTGDFQEALAALLGKDAPNLSPSVLARLKAGWQEEFDRSKRRDLSARRYVYIWADGVYLQGRMEPDKQCILVLIVPRRRVKRR